jgi:uncharacterized membrane protein YhaH (DUF805 family)
LIQFATFAWAAISVAATVLGTISLYHPRLSPSQRSWFWWISALVVAIATTIFAATHVRSVEITCGGSLVILLFYIVPVAALIGRNIQIRKGENPYPQAMSALKDWAFGCLLGALVSSGLIVGVPYLAIALSLIISLLLPYLTLLYVKS